ncbi:hypothetical protein MCHI_000938 [Candidatus Magnetoovum chiemensis]|nr:hypothetical protein MCHI_000938 [Candidatus Magnetoovum chiemensis]
MNVDDEALKKAVTDEITKSIENVLADRAKHIEEESLKMLIGLRDHLQRIKNGQNLTPEDETLLHFIQLLYAHSKIPQTK